MLTLDHETLDNLIVNFGPFNFFWMLVIGRMDLGDCTLDDWMSERLPIVLLRLPDLETWKGGGKHGNRK